MKRAIKKFIVIISIILGITCNCFAHSGRTDSAGGHHVTSTGEYHYHHGEPAHQHINGICPYDNEEIEVKEKGNILEDVILIIIGFWWIIIPLILHIIDRIILWIKNKKTKNKENIQQNEKIVTKNLSIKTKKYICPRCGGELVIKNGKYGSFIGCKNYPKCTYTKELR